VSVCRLQLGLPIYAKQGGSGDAAADEDDEKVRSRASIVQPQDRGISTRRTGGSCPGSVHQLQASADLVLPATPTM